MFTEKFITASKETSSLEKYVCAPYLRKKFKPKGAVKQAILTVAVCGLYELHVNGINITKGFLAPYRSNPDHYVFTDEYSVANLLRDDNNVIAFILGNGMQSTVVETWNFNSFTWKSAPKVHFNLKIIYKDESTQVITSDTDVRVSPSPIIFDDFHYGEYYDARKEIKNWDSPDFDDSDWDNAIEAVPPKGELCPCEAEPIVKRTERKPLSITPFENGYIYDFGVSDAGVCKLKINGKYGQQIEMYHFEAMANGKPYMDVRVKEADRFQLDRYICSGIGTEYYMPRFTYHGFRYVYVTGITPSQATEDLLSFIAMSSDIKKNGSFVCDNEIINKIQQATLLSDISNFYYFPTDCPHREKNGWTADASLSAEQMLLNFKPENSYKVWLKNIYKALKDNGQLPGIVPTDTWGYDWGNGPGWDNVLVNLPYYTYLYRGDKSIFDNIELPLMRYLKYLYSRLNENSLIAIGLGDWCQPNRKDEGDYTTPLVVTDSILTVDIARKAAFIFDILKLHEQKNYAQKLAEKVKKAIRKHLIALDDCCVICNTQTAQAMAIYYNIFTENEIAEAVDNLVALIHKNNDFMDVGVLGGKVIFRVLAQNGYAELAYKMISRSEHPSYGNLIRRGATTLWESFWQEGDRILSMNHHFWGDVSAWFYIYLAGININPSTRNINEVVIKPCFITELNYVCATQETENGRLCTSWKRNKDIIDLVIEFPENTYGELILNDDFEIINGNKDKKLVSGINQYGIILK